MTLIGNIGKLLSLLAQVVYYSVTIIINKLTHYISDITLSLFLRYRRDKITKINSEHQESIDRAEAKIDYYEEQLGI
jgi:hypothetical protein